MRLDHLLSRGRSRGWITVWKPRSPCAWTENGIRRCKCTSGMDIPSVAAMPRKHPYGFMLACASTRRINPYVCALTKATRILVAMRLRETPVPIPNTTVKTQAADGTLPGTARESRWLPDFLKNFIDLNIMICKCRYVRPDGLPSRGCAEVNHCVINFRSLPCSLRTLCVRSGNRAGKQAFPAFSVQSAHLHN